MNAGGFHKFDRKIITYKIIFLLDILPRLVLVFTIEYDFEYDISNRRSIELVEG